MSEKNGISFPPPRKIDPYYDRMIDIYKEKVASLEKDNERLRKALQKAETFIDFMNKHSDLRIESEATE